MSRKRTGRWSFPGSRGPHDRRVHRRKGLETLTDEAPNKQKSLAVLEKVPILEGLSAQELEKVLAVITQREVAPGQEIIRDGESGDTMYVLVKGTVQISKALTLKVSRRDFGEKEKRLIVLDSHNYPIFGEVALLESSERTATVTAVDACTVLEIERGSFEGLCEREPSIGYRIVRSIARDVCARLRKSNLDILKLTTALSLALR